MQRYFTGRLDGPQCSGKPLEPIGEVSLGETFIIESTMGEERETLGPLFIKGVKPGDVVSINIEDVCVSEWLGIFPDHGMLPEILERQTYQNIAFDVPLDNGELVLPGGIRFPLRPMVGAISLASFWSRPNPWDHGGNMDINEIRKGSTVYIRAQREGGLLALGDLHAYQGDGEIKGSTMEANGEVTVTVNVSEHFPAPRPVIEREDKLMTVGMGMRYWDAVRAAVRDMTYFLMKVLSLSLEEAYCVAVDGSLRNGAIWMMSDHPNIIRRGDNREVPRTVFLELPFKLSSQ